MELALPLDQKHFSTIDFTYSKRLSIMFQRISLQMLDDGKLSKIPIVTSESVFYIEKLIKSMTDAESPVVRDILVNSTALIHDNNEDSLLHDDFTGIDVQADVDDIPSPDDLFSLDYSEEEQLILETVSIEQFLSDSSFDVSPNECSNIQQHIIPSGSPFIDFEHHLRVSLSFINPPERVYHVRYSSEITNSSFDENIVNRKKNVSGRYLKGIRGRHITIKLPSIISDNCDLFIRVTRLTVPYQDVSFIHPYPLGYSCLKKKKQSDVIEQGSLIYYKLNKQDICSQSKQFPNIILTRLKQCRLKQITHLYPFGDNSQMSCRFNGNNVKDRIAIYQLKKSHLDFHLVIGCEKTKQFSDTGISCRSNALLEEEGMAWKKSSTLQC